MRKMFGGLLLSCLSFSIFAKTMSPLCVGVTGPTFTSGNGTVTNPYLVCNQTQLAELGTNPTYLNQNFLLGADLNFSGLKFQMIGSQSEPFQGTFNGNGYTLSSISLQTYEGYVGVFPAINHATISNLLLNGVTITGIYWNTVGGLVGYADNSTLTNIHISNLNMIGPNQSGGLAAYVRNSTISNCSVQGTMEHFFASKASGGLLGIVFSSQISSCASHVNIVETQNIDYGVEGIGGLVGIIVQSTVSNCYADGNINYSAVTQLIPGMLASYIGGIAGNVSNTLFDNCYYAGQMIALGPQQAQYVGGALGIEEGSSANNVFWDRMVSGISQSAVGIGETTCVMKQQAFWLSNGYSQTIWSLVDGAYPKLLSELY